MDDDVVVVVVSVVYDGFAPVNIACFRSAG